MHITTTKKPFYLGLEMTILGPKFISNNASIQEE